MARFLSRPGPGRPVPAVVVTYALLAAAFMWMAAQFYLPGKGFTYLIAFGSQFEASRLSKVRKLDYHVERASPGYDAQYYAQIAMDPSLRNRQLPHAVDNLAYRARRILLPALAYALGLGQPAAILQAFAVLNLIAWLLLAILLLHWFPPVSWDRLIRWAGVLFSFGLCTSVRRAVPDGPSLFLLAFSAYLHERNRPGWSATVLGFAGLAKETSLLGVSVLAPASPRDARAWLRGAGRVALAVLPLAVWLLYVRSVTGAAGDAGARNFDLPFAAYLRKWREAAAGLPETGWWAAEPLWNLLTLVAVTVQWLFLVLRPRWDQAWWRLGAAYAGLMVVLGDAVWEGYPSAAARVLLPLHLAFNVLVPDGRRWRALLVTGNLSALAVFSAMEAPLAENLELRGSPSLLFSPGGRPVSIEYGQEWYANESNGRSYWSWTPTSASILIQNPHAEPLDVHLSFAVRSNTRRNIRLRINGAERWTADLEERKTREADLALVRLPPGATRLEFITDVPATRVGADPRLLAFRLIDFQVEVMRKAPAAAPGR